MCISRLKFWLFYMTLSIIITAVVFVLFHSTKTYIDATNIWPASKTKKESAVLMIWLDVKIRILVQINIHIVSPKSARLAAPHFSSVRPSKINEHIDFGSLIKR